MIFAHISDNHLGYMQYGLLEREQDFYEMFERVMDKIIEKKPDFIIHSGDLFETSRPPTKALLKVQENFSRLKDENIPIYSIAGNHDIVLRKNTLPPQVLFKKLGVNILSKKNPFYVNEDIFIGGAPYRSKYHTSPLKKQIKFLEDKSKDYKKRILVLHQAIDKYLPFEYELELSDVPESFNYYAMGHIHQRVIDDYGEGKLVYPGSPEILRIDEIEDYKKKGKGFCLVDMNEDVPKIEEINLKLSREIIRKNIPYYDLEKEILNIRNQIINLPKKPLLNITVEGGDLSRSEIYDTLHKSFSDICLSLRSNYKQDSILNSEDIINTFDGTLDPKSVIKDKLKKFDDEKLSNFVLNLYDEMSNGNLEEAEMIVKSFYEAAYDN